MYIGLSKVVLFWYLLDNARSGVLFFDTLKTL